MRTIVMSPRQLLVNDENIHSATFGHSSLCAFFPIIRPTCPDLNSNSSLSRLPVNTSLRALLESDSTKSSYLAIMLRNGTLILFSL
jgi:hypothetical protein